MKFCLFKMLSTNGTLFRWNVVWAFSYIFFLFCCVTIYKIQCSPIKLLDLIPFSSAHNLSKVTREMANFSLPNEETSVSCGAHVLWCHTSHAILFFIQLQPAHNNSESRHSPINTFRFLFSCFIHKTDKGRKGFVLWGPSSFAQELHHKPFSSWEEKKGNFSSPTPTFCVCMRVCVWVLFCFGWQQNRVWFYF